MPQLSETTYEWGKRTLAEALGAFNSLHSELLAARALLAAANARISELTQGDPSWFDASPADAFRMWADDKKKLTAATERAEKAESQRDRMREALERIAQLDYTRAATNMAAYDAVKLAKAAHKEVGDE